MCMCKSSLFRYAPLAKESSTDENEILDLATKMSDFVLFTVCENRQKCLMQRQYFLRTIRVHFTYISRTFQVFQIHFKYISLTFHLHFTYISITLQVRFNYIHRNSKLCCPLLKALWNWVIEMSFITDFDRSFKTVVLYKWNKLN